MRLQSWNAAAEVVMRRSSCVMNALPVHCSTVISMHSQLNLAVGGRKSISHGATAGPC